MRGRTGPALRLCGRCDTGPPMAIPLRTVALAPWPASRPARSVYREFAPPDALRLAVACTWQGRPGWAPRTLRVLPDGCVDLVWDGERLSVVGASTVAVRQSLDGRGGNVGLRLRPGGAGAILAWPARELPAEGLAVEALWGAAARSVEAELAGAPNGERAVLERLVARRLDAGLRPDPLVVAAARCLRAPDATVAAVAAATGLSARELRRRFGDHVGYGPKALQRILRFHAFVRRVRTRAASGDGLARIAADLGYADQAHLTRECRAISGSTPAALAAAGAPTALGRNLQANRGGPGGSSPA
jgi:AraC-like DNA-binding protein